ncbi:MAG: hypothetical protein ACLTZY_02065 [Alistipes indistinctus]
MNAFFKTFFASLLAVVAGGILFAVLGVMVLVGIGGELPSPAVRQQSPRPQQHTVLKISDPAYAGRGQPLRRERSHRSIG